MSDDPARRTPGVETSAVRRILRRVRAADVPSATGRAVDADTERAAAAIVAEVREGGEAAVLACAARYDGWSGAPWRFTRDDLARAREALDAPTRALLERAAARIRAFAEAQRSALAEIEVPVPGGWAGHTVVPMRRAGCYAPAGRFPLPSSVLMTAVTARAAGVDEVIVATPSASPLMLAAAAIAGADAVLGVGGAHAIAALAYGAGVPACDVIVGPGNRWVTAAKKLVAGDVAIDMLAGPSELVVVADQSADAETVAADLLAQAEHDPDAFTAVVTCHEPLLDAVEVALARQLETLPTAMVARASLANGMAVLGASEDEVVAACDRLAPEHLQLSVRDPGRLAARCRNAGACFLGESSAEVFGDYGVGGNHVLPTGGGARYTAGLSVLTFVRVRTWLRLADPSLAAADVAALARVEGLEAHARAAERRASRRPAESGQIS
jgi:phosphoribosyl-ATP pyrophosphohydrolase/phosphoribosyl-AMP cyclohydrolase/histidinol dehydrogenase